MTRPYTLIAIASALLVALAACGKKSDRPANANTAAIDTAQIAPGAPASQTPAVAPPVADTPVVTHTARIVTSVGDIVVELYGQDAPKTVANFVGLAKKKYYDGVAFHRVISPFMVQTGDPNSRNMSDRSSWGNGGEGLDGGTFADELNPEAPSYKRGYVGGTLAMANGGPNTNGSQFFIVLTTEGASHLTHSYTIFGAVREGMDVVNKIGETGKQGEQPISPVILKTVIAAEGTVAPPPSGPATANREQPSAGTKTGDSTASSANSAAPSTPGAPSSTKRGR